ncbi:MAG: ATP-binding protein [Myxococcales bacterium]|nr:MAG: ATP-binding protein [Myxococcales bacterium]
MVALAVLARGDRDAGVGALGVVDGVADQVQEHVLQRPPLGVQGGRRDLDGGGGRGSEQLGRLAHERVEVTPATLHTERGPLQHVLLHLIGNAIHHARRPDARVAVAAREDGEGYHLTIADNGPGIAPRYHERIWGIFQTLASPEDARGTGIGLSVVKKIVESRGGRAWVESQPGEGATFHVLWPRGRPLSASSLPGPKRT